MNKSTMCKVCGHLAPGCKTYDSYDRIGWLKVICQCHKTTPKPKAIDTQPSQLNLPGIS